MKMAEKPFVCQEHDACDKRYGRKCSLKRHILHKHSCNPEDNNEKPFVCQEDEACNKRYARKYCLTRHILCKHSNRPEEDNEKAYVCREDDAAKSSVAHHVFVNRQNTQPAGSIQRAKQPATDAPPAQRPVFGREWSMKYSQPNAERIMDSHPLRHVPPPSRSVPLPSVDTPLRPSSKRASYDIVDRERDCEEELQPSSKCARYDFVDRERDCEEERVNSSDVADNEYRKTGDVKDQARNDTIIKDFLAYYNENDVDIYSLDLIALFLIKHSKIAKKNDANYFAATSSLYGMVCIMDGLQMQTLYDIVTSYYWYVRTAGLFNWDCLIIAFTMAHNLLMKYPHLKQEIVEMLHEVFYLAGNDLTVSGGWNNFLKYSEKFIA